MEDYKGFKIDKDINAWLCIRCPYCNNANWTPQYSMESSLPDPDGVRCCICEEVYLLTDDDLALPENPKDLYIESSIETGYMSEHD